MRARCTDENGTYGLWVNFLPVNSAGDPALNPITHTSMNWQSLTANVPIICPAPVLANHVRRTQSSLELILPTKEYTGTKGYPNIWMCQNIDTSLFSMSSPKTGYWLTGTGGSYGAQILPARSVNPASVTPFLHQILTLWGDVCLPIDPKQVVAKVYSSVGGYVEDCPLVYYSTITEKATGTVVKPITGRTAPYYN